MSSNSEHLNDDLSAYMDGALPADQKTRVDAHLTDCGDCRAELDELQVLSKRIAALPERELPDGFTARLKLKRLDAEARSYAPLGWLSQPARIAAFAGTGVMVGLVFFNEVRYRLAPKILPDLAATAATGEAAGRSALEAMSEEEIEEARRRLVAQNNRSKGNWAADKEETANAPQSAVVMETAKLLSASAAGTPRATPALRSFAPNETDTASGVRESAPKKKTVARAQASGSPLGHPSYTNDELRDYLDAESRRMGIKKVVAAPAAGSQDPWAGIPDRPLSRDEARRVMAQVTSRLRNANRDARVANNPVASLEGATPLLLGSEPVSRPVGAAESALAQKRRVRTRRMDVVSVPGSRFAETKDQAEAFLEEGQMLEKVQGRREYTEAEGRKLAAAQQEMKNRAAYNSPKPVPMKDMKKEQGLEDVSGVRAMPVRRSWGEENGGLGTAGGAVLTVPGDFADLWKRVGRTEPLPPVDFESEMVVAVFAPSSDSARRVEIVSVAEQGGRILIRYRIVPGSGATGPSSPYHVVVVEKSNYPFGFVQVP